MKTLSWVEVEVSQSLCLSPPSPLLVSPVVFDCPSPSVPFVHHIIWFIPSKQHGADTKICDLADPIWRSQIYYVLLELITIFSSLKTFYSSRSVLLCCPAPSDKSNLIMPPCRPAQIRNFQFPEICVSTVHCPLSSHSPPPSLLSCWNLIKGKCWRTMKV